MWDEQLCMLFPLPEISHLGREEKSDASLDRFPVTQVRETRASGIGTIAWIVSDRLGNGRIAKLPVSCESGDGIASLWSAAAARWYVKKTMHYASAASTAHLCVTKDALVWLKKTVRVHSGLRSFPLNIVSLC